MPNIVVSKIFPLRTVDCEMPNTHDGLCTGNAGSISFLFLIPTVNFNFFPNYSLFFYSFWYLLYAL